MDQDAPLPPFVDENIETIAEFYARHREQASRSQHIIEKMSRILGSPAYALASLVFINCWICANLLIPLWGWTAIDPAPFFWLQGLVSVNAFVISTTVLIRQNRMSKLAEHHAHLDLQVNLLTEKKTSKIIDLLEQLKRDLPNVPDPADPEAHEMTKAADARAVLRAIEKEQKDL